MQNIMENNSLAKHEEITWRHMQLCRQSKKGEPYLAKIEPFYSQLLEKEKALKQAEKQRIATVDIKRLQDLLLDDELRKLHNRAKEYDRDHPGAKVARMLFPNGNISPVITTRIDVQPEVVDQMLKKLDALGSEHDLFPFKSSIGNAVSNCKSAIQAHKNAMKVEDSAKTDAAMAMAKLRDRYSKNYFEAAMEFGKEYAEVLFPVLYNKKQSRNGKKSDQ